MLPIVRERLSQEQKKNKTEDSQLLQFMRLLGRKLSEVFFIQQPKWLAESTMYILLLVLPDKCVFNCCLNAIKTSALSKIEHSN